MVSGERFLPESSTSGCFGPNSSTLPGFSAGAFNGRRNLGCVASDKSFSFRRSALGPRSRAVNERGLARRPRRRWDVEHGARDPVIGKQPVELVHRAFPTLEAYERKGKPEKMTEQEPGPAADLTAIGLAGIDDFPRDHNGRPEQRRERFRRRAEHRIDGIAMMRIAEWYCDENAPARTDDLDATAGERLRIAHMLQDIAAEDGFGLKRPNERQIRIRENIGLDVDALTLPRIQMNHSDSARL